MSVWIGLSAVFVVLFVVFIAPRLAASKPRSQPSDTASSGDDPIVSAHHDDDCDDGDTGNSDSCDAGGGDSGGGDGGGGD